MIFLHTLKVLRPDVINDCYNKVVTQDSCRIGITHNLSELDKFWKNFQISRGYVPSSLSQSSHISAHH